MDENEVKKTVQAAYGLIAQTGMSCCSGGCGCDTSGLARSLGYSESELSLLPDGANLGLSCGNPTALAGLKEGEVVLDLGSGAGFDCFVVSPKVGPSGKVIGVDMTPAMLERARENAKRGNFTNVEFRLGEIENLPMGDNSVDVVISNCVINLSPNKKRVFQEIHRVLKPGGRIAISDMALLKELPEKIRQSMEAYTGCIAGAVLVEEYRRLVEESGIKGIKLTVSGASSCFSPDTTDPIAKGVLDHLDKGESLQDYAVSVYVEGTK
ncbi:MAG TPA: arsenite S-adenosylmethyltransferase [Deltaproteobacteria bacterium]|nr:arsenite S-adenosylmethyltransferase [Deltaproteobacteria bacterium]